MASLRIAAHDRTKLNRELYGLVNKIEGLTANKRDQMLKHYDKILDDLSNRLPPTIASQAGQLIFETESKILSRLAELEPNLKDDELGQRKMDELIKNMENLESTIVNLTSQTVSNVMAQSRKELFDDSLDYTNTLMS